METTYHYQITHEGAVLATGEQTLDLGVLTPNLHKSGLWGDVLRELSDKARLAIKVGDGEEDWYHPDGRNFSLLEDQGEVIDVQVRYTGSLNHQYKAVKL